MSSFQFKQFSIVQKNSAMKVGTDGVLLGAWSPLTNGKVLDIGTGTGLIALMLAQRNSESSVDAIEIDKRAYNEAQLNFNNSPWSERIYAHCCPIQQFTPEYQYDLIVSNPPFFRDSTKAPNLTRSNVRHTDLLDYAALSNAVLRLLKPDGTFSLILPTIEAEAFITLCQEKGLYLFNKISVKPTPSKAPKRTLMSFCFNQQTVQNEELIIETERRHQYTKDYISLTQDFYLNF
jgi:tRNA1Val (adenine37-N6)-methyltransferase